MIADDRNQVALLLQFGEEIETRRGIGKRATVRERGGVDGLLRLIRRERIAGERDHALVFRFEQVSPILRNIFHDCFVDRE